MLIISGWDGHPKLLRALCLANALFLGAIKDCYGEKT